MQKKIGHGTIVCSAEGYAETGTDGQFSWVKTEGVNSFEALSAHSALEASRRGHSFDYLFNGDGQSEDPDAFAKLGRLGEAMVTDSGIIGPKGLPAILTYFGQFIDHDITLNTDSDPDNLPAFSIANEDGSLTRNSRAVVVETIKNGRIASLRLDSLYGDNEEIESFLREGAKMKIGRTTSNRPNDLPRMIDLPEGNEFEDDPKAPLIGDARNDENLVVAQLHLAFLRFHNAVVDQLEPTLSEEERFQAAKRQTILTYQWLVLNDYCGALCDADMLADALNAPAAESYSDFSKGAQIMPLEFSAAAFRFGHSMIRPEYHFNENFGPNGTFGRAPLSELFRFTGGGGLGGVSRLSDVWVIDWNNFLPAEDEERAARGIDSTIAEGLDQLVLTKPELLPVPVREALRHLPARNLRRSYVLAIPTAQQVLADLNDDAAFDPLTDEELLSFANGIIGDEGYLNETPLWLYILLEAELRQDGKRLGKLGSFIVAQVLIGLLVEDPNSILNVGADPDVPWHPSDEPIGGEVIDGLAEMLRFAGVL